MIRAMIVDDHRLVREGLRRTLEDAGIEVVAEASDGAEGVEAAARLLPDVVLMDVSMPVLDGVAATRRLRTQAPGVRVIILTMHADSDLVDRAKAAGAVGYLIKDASGAEVVAAVEQAESGGAMLSPLPDARPGQRAGGRGGQRNELSGREIQILQFLADGFTPAEIADRMMVTPRVVRDHLTRAYDKLDAPGRSQAIVEALRRGAIDPPGR